MNGAEELAGGTEVTVSDQEGAESSLRWTTDAWERFAAGAETVKGVRPEILMSWYRCREEYQVDPSLARAPAAAEASAHSMKHDAMFAEIGGLAALAAREVDGLDGVVTVADGEGRVLASWGSERGMDLAADANLAPWSAWSEWACGTSDRRCSTNPLVSLIARRPSSPRFAPKACGSVPRAPCSVHDRRVLAGP